MKRKILAGFVGLIATTVFQFGCATSETTTAPAASPTVAASPTPVPTVTESLSSAANDLTHALSELRSRNVRGSLELVDRSIGSLKNAASGAGAASRVAIEEAIKKVESTREMIANGDKKAEEALSKVETVVTGLVNSASTMLGDAKESAKSAIGAAADKVKEAVGATPTPAKKATPTPKKKK